MKTVVPVFVAAAFSTFSVALADYSGTSWTADGAGNWSGSVFDTAHWGDNEVPGSSGTAATRMVFAGGVGDYAVSNLMAEVSNTAGVEASVGTGETITFYGRGTAWELPDGTAHDKFFFKTGGNAPIISWSAGATAGLLLDNYCVRYSNAVAGKPGAWLDIDADTFKIASASGTLLWFGDWAMSGDPSGYAGIRFANADIYIPHRLCFGAFNQPTNRVVLSNCRGLFGNGMWSDAWKGNASKYECGLPGLLDIHVTDGSVVTNNGDMSFGYYVEEGGAERFSSRSKIFRLTVDGGSSYVQDAFRFSARGRNEIVVSGAGTSCLMKNNSYLAYNSVSSTGAVEVVSGAKFSMTYSLGLGPQTAANLDSAWATLHVDASTLAAKQAVLVYHGRVTLENGALWEYMGQGYIAGQGLAGATAEAVLDGVTLRTISTDIAPIRPIRNLTAAKIGPRGFVFEPKTAHTVRFEQHFEDLDPENGGELIFIGDRFGEFILSGDATSKESTESRLTIAKYVARIETGCNHYSYLTVTNDATFSLLSDSYATGPTAIRLRGLRLGDGTTRGTLALKADDLVTVENDSLELDNAAITFSSSLGVGEHTVFRLTQEPTEDTVLFWELTGRALVTSGLDSSLYNSFRVVAEGGVWNFKIVTLAELPAKTGDTTWTGPSANWDDKTTWGGAAAPSSTVGVTFAGAEPKEITVSGERQTASLTFADDGYRLSGGQLLIPDNTGAAITATASADVETGLHLYSVLPVDVAAGETVVLGGRILGGGIAKSGEGTLRIENAANILPEGVSVAAGTLETGDPQALGYVKGGISGVLSGGKLRFTEPGATEALLTVAGSVAIENVANGEVELRLPSARTSCTVSKTGPSPLALRADADESWPSGMSADVINVEEGELRFRGSKDATANLRSLVNIGLPSAISASETPAQPGLVLEGAVTSSVNMVTAMSGLPADSTAFATDPYLVISNGATLMVESSFQPSLGAKKQSLAFHLLMDNGTLISTGTGFGVNEAHYEAVSTNYCTLRNGSKITSWSGFGRFSVTCPFVFDMDASELAGGQPGDPRSCLMMYMGGGFPKFSCVFNIRNGSVLRCNEICYNPWTPVKHTSQYTNPWRFNFEDSEWDLGNVSIDMPSSNMNVIVTSTGLTGIVFAPPATRTWKLYTRIAGTGAFTKRGAGHLLVDRQMKYSAYTADPVTLANTGAIRVEGGTMKVVNGALTNVAGRAYCFANGASLDLDGLTLENPVLSGDGELLNATLADPKITVSVSPSGTVSDTPTLDFASVTGRCRIDFGRTADDPLPAHVPFVVAHWTGTKPSAALFRARNAGRNTKVTFVVDDNGTVVATAAPTGFVLLVR